MPKARASRIVTTKKIIIANIPTAVAPNHPVS